MKFKLDSKVRNFYGEADYTIREGILSHKGVLEVEKSLMTNWKPEYGYREGLLVMRVDGRQAKKFAKDNNIEIVKA